MNIELERFGLEGIELESPETRFILILEDDQTIAQQWIRAFSGTPNTRCVVPKIYTGYTKQLIDLIKPERISLILADRFLENLSLLHLETGNLLGWYKTKNPDLIAVETCVVNLFGKRSYPFSDFSISTFVGDIDPIFEALPETQPNTLAAKVYALEKMVIPELREANQLDAKTCVFTHIDVYERFMRLKSNNRLNELLLLLECNEEDLDELFTIRLSIDEGIVFLHNAFSVIGHLILHHGVGYYSMMLYRMRMIINEKLKKQDFTS